MTIEFDLFGLRFRAWYALSESQTHHVLRVSTRGRRPTPAQYAAARERAAELLKGAADEPS